MNDFQIIVPSAALATCVKQYWFLRSDCIGHEQGVIPTGFISLFFHRANPLYSIEKQTVFPGMYINGQTVGHGNLLLTGEVDMICIDFLPHGARSFFNLPLSELREDSVALDLISDPGWVDLGARLIEEYDNASCVTLIERFLIKRYSEEKEYNRKRMMAVVAAVSEGEENVSRLAEISCLGYKQFKRVFADYVGTNPKDFSRIIRFQRALHILQTQPFISLTQLVFVCGFYDQSHMIREFKAFSGYTPGEYIAVCTPFSDYFS